MQILSNGGEVIYRNNTISIDNISDLIRDAVQNSVDLENINLCDQYLHDINIRNVSFRDGNFSYSKIKNVTFVNVDFSDTNFYMAELEEVIFENCKFDKWFIKGVNMININIKQAC